MASLVGIDLRSTMDVDTTVRSLPLNITDAQKIIQEILEIPVGDNILDDRFHHRLLMQDLKL